MNSLERIVRHPSFMAILGVTAAASCINAATTCLNASMSIKINEPVPQFELRGTVCEGEFDRDPPKNPKAKVELHNAGKGVLHVEEIIFFRGGKPVSSLSDAIGNTSARSFTISTGPPSTDYDERQLVSRDDKLTLAVLRPKEVKNNAEWFHEIDAVLKENKVKIAVTYSYPKLFPFGAHHSRIHEREWK